MRNGLALLTLGIGWVLFGVVSCGKDEVTNQVGHCQQCTHSNECASGNVCRTVTGAFAVCATASEAQCCDGADNKTGNCYPLGGNVDGSGGKGGSGGGGIIGGAGKAGKGGTGGGTSGGTGGTGNTSSGSNLGRPCVGDTDCADSKLKCLKTDGLSGDGPPNGMCTATCASNSDCLEIADNTFCYAFTNTDAYCIEGCTEGSLGEPKCHQRADVACSLIGTIPQGTTCATIDDCDTGEWCDSNTNICGTIVSGCVPTCGGDYDCGQNQFCDFDSGFCTGTKPAGLPPGSHCTPATGNATDPCNGFCLAGTDQTEGECSALCVFNDMFTGCGWNGSGPADNGCLFSTVLSAGDPGAGDVGICGKLCDCNAQCSLSGDYCVDESSGSVKGIFGRNGYCRPLQAGETVSGTFQDCPAGSSGGSGGKGGTGGDTGMAGSGATSGESGAGAGGQGGK